jgi:hypothetical protein
MQIFPTRSMTYHLQENSQNDFTVHCLPWEACAMRLQNIRVAASEAGTIGHIEALSDSVDQQSRHAIAADKSGQTIGCARLLDNGKIERIAVMPHVHGEQIRAAMIEILRAHTQKYFAKYSPQL